MSTAGMLSQFLTDIGAAALSPAVDLPATPETTPPFATLHDRLTEEITSLNDQTRQLLEENWSNFQEQVADGKELLVRMEEEETELTELEGELAGDRAFLPSLVERLTAHSKLAQTNSLATHTLTLINSLLGLHTTISTVSNHTTAGSLPLAVASLRELQSALTRGAEPWIESTDAWNALRRWGADEQLRLEGSVAGALDGCFEFSPTTSTAGTTLALRSSIAAAPRGEELSVPVLLQALEDVFVMGGAGKKVDTQLARVSRQLLKYFVVPFLETNGRPNNDGKLEIVYAEERGAWTATIRPRSTESEAPDEDPLKEIATLLTFFATHTHLFPPSPYAANFTANLTPTIQALVISSHLAPSLPATIDLISPYLATLSAASTFESSFLATSGYFAFLPKESHGQMREEGKVVQSWVERVDKHWAGKVGDAALEKVRQDIVQGDWEGEMMDVDVEIEGEGGRPKMVKEQMLVSVRSMQLVRVADEVLDKATAVGSPDFPHPTFATASSLLLRTFISILSLYRAIVPVQHATVLSTVPSIGVQFANDTDWIGEAVEAVWRKSKSGQSSELDADVEKALKMTKKMGKDWREKQILTQRESLMESLDVANRFLYTGDDARFAACERALAQVTMTLQRLVKVWKPVMNPTAFYSTLGNLVNDVLQRVLDEIMEQIDISEEESIRLNKLCKQLHDVEGLFEGDVTSIGIEVPVWFKFVFLSELLEASMADILFLFDDGHLVDFEPAAIAKLVRALFSDSPLRNRNLEHILKGHPTVVPDNDTEDGSRAPSPTRHVAPPPPPRTPSPPPAPAPATRSGRQPLGTRIVNAKPSTPSPPPTPPRRSPSPPPPAALPVETPAPAVQGTPEIDPELDASFDDFHADDDWGFSAEASPAAESSALPSPPPAAAKAIVSPPPSPKTAIIASPPPPPPSKPLSPPLAAPRSLDSPPASAALAITIAASLAAVTSKTSDGVATFSSNDGAGEAADDAWDLDWEEESSAVGSLPKESSILAPLSESKPAPEADAAAEPELPETGLQGQGGEGWGLGEEEQDLPASASPVDAPFEFDEDPSPVAEPLDEDRKEEVPAAFLPFEATPLSSIADEAPTSPLSNDAPFSPPLDDTLLSPSTDEAIISPHPADAALSPPVAESPDLPARGGVISDAQRDVEDAPEPASAAEDVVEPSDPQQDELVIEEEAHAPAAIAAEPATTEVEEIESTPFDAPVAQDDSTASSFLNSPPSAFDQLGTSPFGDTDSSSFFDNLGPGPVEEPRATLEQPSVESPVERPLSPPLVAFESESQPIVSQEAEVDLEASAVVEQPEEQDLVQESTPEHVAVEETPLAQDDAPAEEEAVAEQPVSSPIVHAQHTAVIVHEEYVPAPSEPEELPAEAEESGWDLGAEDESTPEIGKEPSSLPADAVVEHIDHVEDGSISIDQKEEGAAEPSQLIEDVAREQAPRPPSPPPRSPSPPLRSPSPTHHLPSPPADEPSEQLNQELEEDHVVAIGLPSTEDQHVAVEDVITSAADPIFAEETVNDAASPSEESAVPSLPTLDSATTFDEQQPTPAPPEESTAAEPPAPAFDERAFSPSAGLGSSPEMLEHLSSPITSPELVDNVPLPEDESTPAIEELSPSQVDEDVEVEPIERVEIVEPSAVAEPSTTEQQPSLVREHFDEVHDEEPSREELPRKTGETEDEDDGGWGLGAEEEEAEEGDEAKEIEHVEQASPAVEISTETTTQLPPVEDQVDSPPQVRAVSSSPIPTPPSPLLSPVLDAGPIPTPLQQATPPSLPTPSLAINVATPAQELHLDEEPFARAAIAEPLTPGGHESPALVPEERQELVEQEAMVQQESEEPAEEAEEAVIGSENEGAGEEGEEDDGWGLGDELEGLEEAGEDEPLPPIAYTPVSPPRPLPYAHPISPPPLARPAPLPATPTTTYGRLSTSTKTSAPPPRVPHFFSPPKVAPPAPAGDEPEDDGWGFDEEESNGLGYMEDDGPANENEELGQDLYSPSSQLPVSPPRRNGHVAKKESVDDDGWGF